MTTLLAGPCLNPDKTEAIVVGTGTRLKSEEKICAVEVADTTVPVTTVKSLGVTVDSTLSFSKQRLQGSLLPRPCLTSHPSLHVGG